ncbi:MAG: peptidoglycan recognition protein family protein [Stackebrandtia sp.]
MSSRPLFSRRTVIRGAFALGAGAAVAGGTLLTSRLAFADDTLAVPEPEIDGTEVWGANPDDGSLYMHDFAPSYLVVHHTTYPNTTDYSREQAHAHAREVQRLHQEDNGWADTGYHFIVSRGGFITEGRHRSLEGLRDGGMFVHGAHANAPANSESVAVSLEGDYTGEQPTQEQWDSLVEMLAHACSQYGIAPDGEAFIIGHRDAPNNSTACPGDSFHPRLGELREAVRQRLNEG